MRRRSGRCNCGKVELEMQGEPARVGLCHCQTCRRETGGAYLAFAVWPKEAVVVRGETQSWSADLVQRHFCPDCGVALFSTEGTDEIDIRLGALDDAPSGLSPGYEIWVVRREHWLSPVPGAVQHERDRE